MKRGLAASILVLFGIGIGTGWFFIRIEYGGWSAFLKELDRRFSSPVNLSAAMRRERLHSQRLPVIQQGLRERSIDGWLFCSYRRLDPLAESLLLLEPEKLPQDRWFYLIPAKGVPEKLVHRSEPDALDNLPGETRQYQTSAQLREELRRMLALSHRLAMQYSPENELPMLSRVDGGTLELVRGLGKEIVSSAELVQLIEARWTDAQLDQHRRAARLLSEQMELAFGEVRAAMESGEILDERRLQMYLSQQLERSGLRAYDQPMVAFGANTLKARYAPPEKGSAPIVRGGVLIIGIWGRVDESNAVMAKLVWTGYVGEAVPTEIEQAFQSAVTARDTAAQFIADGFRAGRRLEGWMPDLEVRKRLQSLGLGASQLGRTGHSLGQELQGWGADLDGMESKDTRPLIPRTGFTIEPGITLEKFGVKTGMSVYLGEKGLEITTQPLQQRVVAILKP